MEVCRSHDGREPGSSLETDKGNRHGTQGEGVEGKLLTLGCIGVLPALLWVFNKEINKASDSLAPPKGPEPQQKVPGRNRCRLLKPFIKIQKSLKPTLF